MDPIYVAARKALLDALFALEDHKESLILVGAQAVYLHTASLDLPVGASTKDADIAIDPGSLATIPNIEEIMQSAGFRPGVHGNPGEWCVDIQIDGAHMVIPVDLLVPESIAPGSGRRSARLEGHGKRSARVVRGIEAVVVDNALHDIEAFESHDERTITCRVAGPAALLVAKAHKLADRLKPDINPDRLNFKDALDAYRIARAVPLAEMRSAFDRLLGDQRSAAITDEGLSLLSEQFGFRRAAGVEMAVTALAGVEPPERIAEVFRLLIETLLMAR